jgi:hypothetical protein
MSDLPYSYEGFVATRRERERFVTRRRARDYNGVSLVCCFEVILESRSTDFASFTDVAKNG